MDESTEDQRLEHHRSPPKFIEISDLCKLTGVEHYKVILFCCIEIFLNFDVRIFNDELRITFLCSICTQINHQSFETDEVLQSLKKVRGYTYEDEFQTEESKPDYEAKVSFLT